MFRKFNACLIVVMVLLVALTLPIEANDNSLYIGVNKVLSGNSTDILYPTGYLIDNDWTTSWKFKSDAQEGWAELELEKRALIQGLELSGTLAMNTELRVEYKRGDNWIPFLAPSIDRLAGEKFIDLSYDEIVTDRIRLRVKGLGLSNSELTEIKILGERVDGIYHVIEVESITASENTDYTYPAKFLVDGNTYTMWRSKVVSTDWRDQKFDEILESEQGAEIFSNGNSNNQDQAQVLFELGRIYQLDQLKIYFNKQAKGNLKIEVNNEGNWKELATINADSQEGWYPFELAEEVSTDQIRFVVIGSGGGLGGIGEVQFWGKGDYKGSSKKLIGIQEGTSLNESINRHFTLTSEEINDYYLELAIKEESNDLLTIELNGREFKIEPTFTLRGYTIYRQKIKKDYLWTGSNFLKVGATEGLTLVNASLRNTENKSRQIHSIDQLDDGILFNGVNNQEELELSLISEGYRLPEFPNIPEFPTGLENKGTVQINDWTNPTVIADDGYYESLSVISSLIIDTSNGDRILRVKSLTFGSNGNISIEGDGQVYLYVENDLEIGSGSRINGIGRDNSLVIYHSGARVSFQGGIGGNDKYKFAGTLYTQADQVNITGGAAVQGAIYIEEGDLTITGGATVAGGSFYTKSGTINITGGAKVEGSLLSGGEEIVITGGSTMAGAEGGIYAPNAWIDLDGGALIEGKIIATSDKVRIGNINHRESYYSIPQIDFSKEKRLVEEVEIYANEDNPYFKLYAWIDGSWVELYETEHGIKSVKYQQSIKTDKLLVENPGGFTIGEIRVEGAATTNREAEVEILTPIEKEVLDNKELKDKRIIGFVDNPNTQVTINGNQVWKRGHYFWLESTRIQGKKWEENNVFAVAKDNQGRVSADQVEVLLGDKPFFTIDQADELVYTNQQTFKISGSMKQPLNQLLINGEEVEVEDRTFNQELELEEGFNLIEIEVAHQKPNGERKFVKTIYRKVVSHTKAMALTIGSPLTGYYTNQEQIVVNGIVDGLGEVKVKVNGQEADIDGMFYTSLPISLSEGSNLIKVEAVDQIGKVEKEITVYKDTTPPSIEDVVPAEGYISNNSVVEIRGQVIDQSPVWIYTNGKAAWQNEAGFNNQLIFVDGKYLITVKAVDMAGNIAEHTINVIVDTTAPEAFETIADPAGWTNNNQPIISFATTDATSGIDHYELAVDDGEFEEIVSPYQLPAQEDGEHQIRVKAIDKAGWETISQTKVYIDTTPPGTPEHFRPVPGNGKMILRWEKPAPDVVEYIVERESEGVKRYYSIDGEEVEFVDDELENGKTYKYRIQAIDRADNKSSKTEWKEGTVGLAKAPYTREEGGLIEYENVSLALPQEGLPEGISKVEITEIKSEYLQEKSLYPMVSPIYEFSAFREGSETPEESIAFDRGYLAKIEYDEDLVPEGFLERNLGVYHYDPMFDKWFLIPTAGVDIKNNTIYFVTDHFSAFSVQATIMQDLSPQEYKDTGFSPLKTYAKHGGVVVSPQGGSASTQVTELELPGRNGFDLNLSRKYNSSVARSDAFSMAVNAELGFNVLSSNNGSSAEEAGAFLSWDDIKDSADFSMGFNDVSSTIVNTIKKYLTNQGDYAYSMGQGWRLNIPYVKQSNSSIILSTAEGNMYYINEMEISKTEYPEGLDYKRVLTFEHHEGEDFTFIVEQVKYTIDGITTITGDNFTTGRWYTKEYKLILKDGTTYEMDFLGRTKKKTDPFGINQINFHYGKDLLLDYIEDSMGRKVKFDYHWTLMWPRIKKIWVEGDPYNRTIDYDIDSYAKLEKVKDIGGRISTYDYEIELLYGATAGAKFNTALMMAKLIAHIFPGGGEIVGAVASAFGEKDITLFASLKVQFVVALSEMEVPGQGLTKISYKRYKFNHTDMNVKKVLKIPVSITLSVTMDQRLMARKVEVYLDDGEDKIKETTYQYDIRHYEGKQSHNYQTIESDGKKKTIYHYKPIEKERNRWEDTPTNLTVPYKKDDGQKSSITIPMTIRTTSWTTHVLGINDVTEIYDIKNNKLLERDTVEYDLNTLRPISKVIEKGINNREISYDYDNWGNMIYSYDSATDLVTESYYLNTDSSKEGFATPDFSQGSVRRSIHNLLGGKIVYNHNSRDGEIKEESAYCYDNQGKLLVTAKYHQDQKSGDKTWIESSYSYDQYGNVIKAIDPKGNVTETEYSADYKYAYPTLVKKYQGEDKVYLEDADNQKLEPVVYKYGYDFYLGQKSWEIDPEGNLTEYQYDSLSRLVKITYPEDGEIPDKSIAELSPQDYQNRDDNPVKIQYYDDENLITTVVNATEDIEVNDYLVKNESISSPIFNKSKYYYDKLGRWVKLEQYLNQDSTTSILATEFEYDGYGNRIKTIDAEGKTTQQEYDVLNRVTKISYPDSSYATIEYDDNKLTRTITDREGNKTIEFKDLAGNVIQLTRVNNGVNYTKTAQYDALGNQISMSDELGRRIDHYYNDLNQLIKEELAADEYLVDGSLRTMRPTITYEYDLNGNKIQEVDAKGNPMSYEYDALNRVIRVIDSEGNVTKKYYDALGQEIKIVQVDKNGIVLSKSEFDYDSRGNKIAQIDGEGNTSYFAYDIVGKEIAHYDPRGVGISTTNGEREYILDDKYKIESEYDSLGRKVKTIYPSIGGEKIAYDEKIEYDRVGNKTKVITGDKEIEYLYDDSYNITDQIIRTSEETRTTSYTYDRMGNKLTESDPEGNITTYQYDDLYRLTKVTKADGSSQEYGYDRVGNKLWEKDGNGNLREYNYNSLDKLIAVYEAGISTPTEYQYDPNGNLVKKIMSNGLVTEYEYNSLNQQIKEIKAGNQVTVYNYDGAGKLKTKINPLGIKEEYLYYLNGQLEEINYYQNQEDEVANESTSYEYDKAGNRVLVEKEDSSIEQVYDQLGRIVSESRSISGKVYSTEYKYDKYGNLVGIKYPESDEYLNYGYDSLNQLKYIEGIAGDEDNPAFSYNDNGQVETMKYDNGVT
ncbi:hypothetical protein U472_08220 [Orenia metallireducens]|uniref:Fibronectin type-III domain-containing protein n=2 Tax=Orenia metallireducens TaxID=1413210 RepID=A0A1C0A6Y6_9FIRM|nr:hypothetical protein U472_08220 [Orenia metallireducens]